MRRLRHRHSVQHHDEDAGRERSEAPWVLQIHHRSVQSPDLKSFRTCRVSLQVWLF